MRVNIYNEEITGETLPVKKVRNGVTFKGIRLFFKFKEEPIAHKDSGDDDTPGVTFWFQDEDGPFYRDRLRAMFLQAAEALADKSAFDNAGEG